MGLFVKDADQIQPPTPPPPPQPMRQLTLEESIGYPRSDLDVMRFKKRFKLNNTPKDKSIFRLLNNCSKRIDEINNKNVVLQTENDRLREELESVKGSKKRKRVPECPNGKFANIEAIKKARDELVGQRQAPAQLQPLQKKMRAKKVTIRIFHQSRRIVSTVHRIAVKLVVLWGFEIEGSRIENL